MKNELTKDYWTYFISRCPDTGRINVEINPISYWKRENCLADQYTDEEWDDLRPTLEKFDLYEVVESTFETLQIKNTGEMENLLLSEGFVKMPDFEKEMSQY